MSPLAAAIALSWVAIIVLALGLAGMLAQVRDLQSALAELNPTAGRHDLIGRAAALPPGDGSERALLLVVNHVCSSCREVLEALAEQAPRLGAYRLLLLSYQDSPDWHRHPGIEVWIDPARYRELDLPWTPGLLTVEDGIVVAVRGVGSAAELRAIVAGLPDAPVGPAALSGGRP